MKNTLRKIAYVLSAAALITVGAANVYADNYKPNLSDKAAYDRFETVKSGNGSI